MKTRLLFSAFAVLLASCATSGIPSHVNLDEPETGPILRGALLSGEKDERAIIIDGNLESRSTFSGSLIPEKTFYTRKSSFRLPGESEQKIMLTCTAKGDIFPEIFQVRIRETTERGSFEEFQADDREIPIGDLPARMADCQWNGRQYYLWTTESDILFQNLINSFDTAYGLMTNQNQIFLLTDGSNETVGEFNRDYYRVLKAENPDEERDVMTLMAIYGSIHDFCLQVKEQQESEDYGEN